MRIQPHPGGLRRHLLMVATVLLFTVPAHAQDTLRTTIGDADKLFLTNNLFLLAGRLNIDAQRALIIQARAYPNPNFTGEINLRDPQNDRWFHAGATGQKAFGIEQLILLGGKRQNQIELARQNLQLASLQLEDLLRNLRQQLHKSIYTVYFNYRTVQKYNEQLTILDTLIENYSQQAQKGNLSLKDVVRLKSTYIQVNNSKTELLQSILEEEKNLAVLLRTGSYVLPQLDDSAVLNHFQNLPPLDSLQLLADLHRPDKQAAELNTEIAQTALRYQRSLAVPDLTMGANYDQRGGAFTNQVNLTFGVPLPVWNRNKGGIRLAEAQIRSAGLGRDIQQAQVRAEVTEAYRNMLRSVQEYRKTRELYNDDFYTVFNGITENFRRRNISMLEFLDFFESYSDTQAEISQVRKQLLLSAEELNSAVAYPVF